MFLVSTKHVGVLGQLDKFYRMWYNRLQDVNHVTPREGGTHVTEVEVEESEGQES